MALLDFAEEFGRMLARQQESGRTRHRRAYGLLEGLIGLSVMAVVSILAARVLGSFLH